MFNFFLYIFTLLICLFRWRSNATTVKKTAQILFVRQWFLWNAVRQQNERKQSRWTSCFNIADRINTKNRRRRNVPEVRVHRKWPKTSRWWNEWQKDNRWTIKGCLVHVASELIQFIVGVSRIVTRVAFIASKYFHGKRAEPWERHRTEAVAEDWIPFNGHLSTFGRNR